MDEEVKKYLSVVNSSGFLLQLGLNHLIHSTFKNEEHDYNVKVIEHPWRNGNSSEEGFVDLILDSGYVKLIVECKRPLDGEWIFLVNEKATNNISKSRGYWSLSSKDSMGISSVSEFAIRPNSFQSSVCLIRGQGETKLSLLERLSGQLLNATESVVLEELTFAKNKLLQEPYVYFPIIITTAELNVARINENDISMKNGKINNADFMKVPFIRFRKSLVNTLTVDSKPTDLSDSNKNKERTIFVVNSESIIEFLKYFRVDAFGSYPWQKL